MLELLLSPLGRRFPGSDSIRHQSNPRNPKLVRRGIIALPVLLRSPNARLRVFDDPTRKTTRRYSGT